MYKLTSIQCIAHYEEVHSNDNILYLSDKYIALQKKYASIRFFFYLLYETCTILEACKVRHVQQRTIKCLKRSGAYAKANCRETA